MTTPLDPEYLNIRRTFRELMNIAEHSHLFWANKADLITAWNKSVEISEALKDMKSQHALDSLAPKNQSLSKLFAYLGLVESLGVTFVDMTLMLLVANGKEVHIRKDGGMMHLTKFRDLPRINLIYKLGFLDENGLGFVSNMINRQLRNDIAHLKFKIGDDGEIRGSGNNIVKIDEVLAEFWQKIEKIMALFDYISFLRFLDSLRPIDDESDLHPLTFGR
jgi:hypothetical protein